MYAAQRPSNAMRQTGRVATSGPIPRASRSNRFICAEEFICRMLPTDSTDVYPPAGGPFRRTDLSPIEGIFRRSASIANFSATVTSIRGHQFQENTHDQSEARSPHAAELADHLYRSSAADGVRRAVHRPPDAQEQRRRPRQGSEGVQDPDHYHYGRNSELLRLHLSGAARGVPRQA